MASSTVTKVSVYGRCEVFQYNNVASSDERGNRIWNVVIEYGTW